ncbi:hypothetical protein ET445_15815 [Agromyces protaetiae]|uniref:Hemagglutinin n=1 Tax=Agromyces protaetiae TaxID=2509455 RepID=A0A4P6FEI8_9MICO|nr:hypothetical protein [Agromyces protaetiae]QAY74582.1 hypothetical protein ET445_15815 [Agromyces protaetiae]
MPKKTLVAVAAVFALLLGVVVPMTQAPPAEAAVAAQFNPGNIIDDALFYDGGALPAASVQSFLNSKVSVCRSGYTCLKDYRQSTSSKSGEAGRCGPYQGAANESAAQIIFKVGAACGISQKALIVLLEKEQSLVTDDWPVDRQYRSATGYGCPDTADCDAQFYGFQNQVWMAALQFKRYAANPGGWNHIAGRVNAIRFNPNAACGTSQVFIQNTATAGLYNYTPYQPNAAALANLYGTGDSCSAYGNRNFWRIFTDWFGSTTVSSLMRTASSATVYVIGDGIKYALESMTMLSAYEALGGVTIVSDSYLASIPTGQNAGRVIRAPNGSIYFIDASIKLPFATCAEVEDYGGSCDPSGFVQLTGPQIDRFHTGPAITPVLATVEGGRYYIKSGVKREILDDASQVAAGIPLGHNVLTENAIAKLPLGDPIIRDSVYAETRGTPDLSLLANGSRHAVLAGDLDATGAASRVTGSLSSASLARIAASPQPFSGYVSNNGIVRVLASAKEYTLGEGYLRGGAAVVSVSDAFVSGYPDGGALARGSFVKSGPSATVFVVMPDSIRPIASWDALLRLSVDQASPNILIVPQALPSTVVQGAVALSAGNLYRTPENATVYLINGVTSRIAFSKFNFPSAAGFDEFAFTTKERLEGYPLEPTLLTFAVRCDSQVYVTAGGQVRSVTQAQLPLFPFSPVDLDSFTCRLLAQGPPATEFIRTSNGSLFQLVGGEKRPISSLQRFNELSGGRAWMQVDDYFAAAIPTGAPA